MENELEQYTIFEQINGRYRFLTCVQWFFFQWHVDKKVQIKLNEKYIIHYNEHFAYNIFFFNSYLLVFFVFTGNYFLSML